MKKNIEDQWPRCAEHTECQYQSILLSKKCTSNRLVCIECLYSEDEAKCKQEFIESIPLSIALRRPDIMINQLKSNSQSKQLKTLFKFCEKDLDKLFNEQIAKFEILIKVFNQIKDEIKQRLSQYKEVQEKLLNLKSQLFEKSSCNLLNQSIAQLKEFDKQFKSDQYTQVLAKINSTIEEILKDDSAVLSKCSFETIQNHNQMKINFPAQNNEQYLAQITKVFTDYAEFILNLNKHINSNSILSPQSKLLTNDFVNTLQQKIEERSKKSIQQWNLLYLGSRDGLAQDVFWSKINGKKNLLMIIKANTNYIIGGYSPCHWQSNVAYVKDDDNTSFLFSQTKNLIFPLKQEQKGNAIYSNSSYGPIFGSGHDLYVHTGFKTMTANLGGAYFLDQQYQNQGNQFLLGEQTSAVLDFEAFEIIYS